MIVLPLMRFYNNNHNPFKACMTLRQSSATECFVAQGGCGRTANRVSLWKIAMATKPGEGASSGSVDCKTSAQATVSVTRASSRVVLDGYSEADSKGPRDRGGDEKKGGRLAYDESDHEDKEDYYGTDGEEGGGNGCDGDGGIDGDVDDTGADGEPGPAVCSEAKLSFRQKEYECLLTHAKGYFSSSSASGVKGEGGFEDDNEPEIPNHSYLAHDHHILLGLRNIAIESIVNTFNYPLTPLMQPSCLQLQLVNSGEIKARASTGNLVSRKNYNMKHSGTLHHNNSTDSTIIPQYLYVGLGDGPIYKIVLI